MAGAWASTQLGNWQGPNVQDLGNITKQRGARELGEKQRTKTELQGQSKGHER